MRDTIRIPSLARTTALIVALAGWPHLVHADAPPPEALTLTSLRSWTAPGNTRVVLDFSASVSVVMPDSGVSRLVVVRVPGERIQCPPAVPTRLVVADGTVDSVEALIDGLGRHLHASGSPTPTSSGRSRCRRWTTSRSASSSTWSGQAAMRRRRSGSPASRPPSAVTACAWSTIDAGHGGDDTGARGPRGVLEKNVTLAIARALAAELGQIDGVRAVLTRDCGLLHPAARALPHRGEGEGRPVHQHPRQFVAPARLGQRHRGVFPVAARSHRPG